VFNVLFLLFNGLFLEAGLLQQLFLGGQLFGETV
jgi:hypothetical protein